MNRNNVITSLTCDDMWNNSSIREEVLMDVDGRSSCVQIIRFLFLFFGEILLDLIYLSLPFFLFSFLHTLLSFQKTTCFFWIVSVFAVSFFLQERHDVSSFFLFFLPKSRNWGTRIWIAWKNSSFPWTSWRQMISLSKPRKRDVFLVSGQLWRCWRSQLALSYSK